MASEEGTSNMNIDEIHDNSEEMDSDNGSDGGSDESTSGSESEEVKESKIKELMEKICENPYHYDSHTELITLLRKGGELEQLRMARDQMSKLFPLTSDLWMEWLTDEAILCSQNDDRKDLAKLFEKAIKDYISVPIWLEYAQFSIGNMSPPGDATQPREIFERALTAVGLHVTDGAMIWDAYREFEMVMLATLQATPDIGEDSKEFVAQKNRILNLFKRQLSVPLFDMEKTYQEYKEWAEEEDPNIKSRYQSALKKLEAIKPFEAGLMSSEAPHLNEYMDYLNYEEKQGEPARIQCLYERAIADNCLVANLWLTYLTYLDHHLKMDSVSMPVYERAVRNCPWVASLWIKYITAAERYKLEHSKVKAIVDAAFQSGLTTADDYRSLWFAFLNYVRRRMKWDEEHELELEQLRAVFQKSVDHLQQAFGADGDPSCSILKYWAKVEAKFCKNLTKAREIWNLIIHSGLRKSDAETWIEYANFERAFGDDKRYRKTLHRGLLAVTDWPETIGDLLLTFEREEGTLETYETAEEKYNSQMMRVLEKRKKLSEKEQNVEIGNQNHLKRKFGLRNDNVIDSDGFKIPHSRMIQSGSPYQSSNEERQIKKPKVESKKMSNVKKDKPPVHSKNEVSPRKMEIPPPVQSQPHKHDHSKDKFTVFVSNLDYGVEEDRLKDVFKNIGDIEEIRLVRTFKGVSKGYSYIQFKTQEAVQEALKRDRELLDGRPMFISKCKDQTSNDSTFDPQFKFKTSLEKNKLFIRGLPFSTTEKDLEELFSQYGKVKQIRLVTYRNGHSKGLAYVEYEEESAATKALLNTDGLEVGSQKILVAYSNPPQRKPKGEPTQMEHITRKPSTNFGVGRGRPPVLLVPRSVKSTTEDTSSKLPINKLSNSDFRALLNK